LKDTDDSNTTVHWVDSKVKMPASISANRFPA